MPRNTFTRLSDPLNNGLGILVKCDTVDGVIVKDSSIENNHIILNSGVFTVTDGKLVFDGTSSLRTYSVKATTISTAYASNTDPFSITLWLQALGAAGGDPGGFHFFLLSTTGVSSRGSVYIPATFSYVAFQYTNTAGSTVTFISNFDFSDFQEHHVAIVFDGTYLTSYVDGGFIKTELAVGVRRGATVLIIGSRDGSSYIVNGAMRDLRIYNRVISLSEIRMLAGV